MTEGSTDHNRKVRLMQALPLAVEYDVNSPMWLVAPSIQVSLRKEMPLKVTVSGGIFGLLPGFLQGLTFSATLTLRVFCTRLVPAALGRINWPLLSDWLETVDPGGNLKRKPYLTF